jgi:hypothetical protein
MTPTPSDKSGGSITSGAGCHESITGAAHAASGQQFLPSGFTLLFAENPTTVCNPAREIRLYKIEKRM